MKLFKLTQKAKKDLIQIAIYTSDHWGKKQRNLYIKQFDDTFKLLANNTRLGKRCDYIKNGYREFPQGSHIIFYKKGSISKIEIIRILHKSMDITSHISN